MKKMKYFIVLVFTLFVIGLPNVIFSQPKEDLLMGYIDKIDEIHYDISESISQIYYSFLSVNCDNIYGYIKEIAALSDAYRKDCLLYTSPSPRDLSTSRMPSSA